MDDVSLSSTPEIIAEAASYGSNLEISENLGAMSSNMESVIDMATDVSSLSESESLSEELLMSGKSALGLKSLMNPESIVNNIQSSINDSASMASNLMDYTSLINSNPLMSMSEKAQYLSQLTSFKPMQLSMVSDLFGMLGSGFVSHMQWKMSVIRAAKEQLALAMQALANGDLDAVRMHVMEAIHILQGMCPICRALKYALDNDDFTMLSFVGNMGMNILGQMEMEADISVSD